VFQLYCDFSGYSDIAIGSAKILGYDLMDNFRGPLLSKNMGEFWSRWHISLSTWFRDYLYMPLATLKIGGNRLSKPRIYLNLLIVFFITGLWHGAGWNFIIWGLLIGMVVCYEAGTRKFRKQFSKRMNKRVYNGISIFLTLSFWTFCCSIFRANSIQDFYTLIGNIFTGGPEFWNINIFQKDFETVGLQISLVLLVLMSLLHYIEYKQNIIDFLKNKTQIFRWSVYITLLVGICLFGAFGGEEEFIYFQF